MAVELFSVEAEQAVIGACLIAPAAFDVVSETLSVEDFYGGAHRAIYAALTSLNANGKPVDVLTVAEALKLSGQLRDVGGLPYLHDLAQSTPGPTNARRYAEIVKERAMLRDLKARANAIIETLDEAGVSAREKVDAAQASMMELTHAERRSEPRGIRDVALATLIAIDEARARGGRPTGLSTGLTDLDRKMGGFERGDLILIAGRPSMGKTTFALQIAENMAQAGLAPGILSMEMGERQLGYKLVSSLSAVPLDKVRFGQLDDEEFMRVDRAAHRLADMRMSVDDTSALTIAQVRSKARSMKRRFGLDVLLIDYVQMMSGQGDNRNAAIEQISRGLKALARELNIPVVALSQLNRGVEQRPNKRPVLSDLRDSGALEQDSDVVIALYRDDYYNEDSPDKGTAEAILLKVRMGEVGTVRVTFLANTGRFVNYTGSIYPTAPATAPKRAGFAHFADRD